MMAVAIFMKHALLNANLMLNSFIPYLIPVIPRTLSKPTRIALIRSVR